MDGAAVHALEDDSFTASLHCHDPNGEALLGRVHARPGDDLIVRGRRGIRGKVETWADTVPALA